MAGFHCVAWEWALAEDFVNEAPGWFWLSGTGVFTVCLSLSAPQGQMIIQDKLEKERNDAKNAVEEYVYDLRDKLCGIYEKYISEEVGTCRLMNRFLWIANKQKISAILDT